MEINILEKIFKEVENGVSGALVTITESQGSTPRKSGTIMGVWKDDFLGTIGGGMIEHRVIELSRELIKEGRSKEFYFDLTKEAELGMSCGGSVKGYIKIFKPKNRIVIIGAGHIGEKIYGILKNSEFQIEIIDDRLEYINSFSNVRIGNIYEEIKKIPENPNTYYVIVTKGHSTDLEALKSILENKKYNYIGMVGSKRKVIGIKEELLKLNDENWNEKIYSPIGLKISDGTPFEIALEIVAEILTVKNEGKLEHRRI
ncbi:XdhC family protein [uncultured Cetobacterium sp.]|uniref:XdhC family protein n=1 Tax=uncultured Cetobacterium sp. TaxID=527638 RepID=UPI002605F51D|nr:XdhC family protein [uncultured Cetobacterium sp.]